MNQHHRPTRSEGLVLDKEHTRVFLTRCVREGLIPAWANISRQHAPVREAHILETMILYDTLFLDHESCSGVDLSSLVNEGIVQVLEYPSEILNRWNNDNWTQYLCDFFITLDQQVVYVSDYDFWSLFSKYDQNTIAFFKDLWSRSVRAKRIKEFNIGMPENLYEGCIDLIIDETARNKWKSNISKFTKVKRKEAT